MRHLESRWPSPHWTWYVDDKGNVCGLRAPEQDAMWAAVALNEEAKKDGNTMKDVFDKLVLYER